MMHATYVVTHSEIIQMLGGKCRLCGDTVRLDVNHRWYTEEDRSTHTHWDRIRKLIMDEPGRFSCLCHRHNVLAGHVSNAIEDGTLDRLLEEARIMADGRRYSPISPDIMYASALQTIAVCICGKQFPRRGNSSKKYCGRQCSVQATMLRQAKAYKETHPAKQAICIECGREFQQHHEGHIVCGTACSKKRRLVRDAKYNPPKFAKCEVCGQKYKKNNQRKTCGQKCHETRMSRWRKQANPPAFKQCVVCGEEFRYRGGPRRTCDKAACKKKRADELYAKNKPPVMGKCVVCNKEYKKNNMRKTCSPECRKEHKAKYWRDKYTKPKSDAK